MTSSTESDRMEDAISFQFIADRSYYESPHLHFARLQAMIKAKKFDDAIALALEALFHAAKVSS